MREGPPEYDAPLQGREADPRDAGSGPMSTPREVWDHLLDLWASDCERGVCRAAGSYLPAPVREEPKGRIDRFRLIEPLGQGGQATVWKAIDDTNGACVALKVLSKNSADDPQALLRLRREAALGREIKHPGIVRFLDSGFAAHGPWIAFECVPGATLARELGKCATASGEATEVTSRLTGPAHALRPMTMHPPADPPALRQRIRWIQDLAAAVGALHEAGICHRDLKPENALVTPEGRVVLLDLGLAGFVEDHGPRIAPQGSTMGTPAYMAPEQFQGEPVGTAADVWSLGVMLYEATTGTRPFGGSELSAVATAVQRDEPLSPREVLRFIPPAVERVILRCLRKDPSRRPHDAVALVRELAACLEAMDAPPRRTPRILLSRDAAMLIVGLFLGSAMISSAPERQGAAASLPVAVTPTTASDGPSNADFASGLGDSPISVSSYSTESPSSTALPVARTGLQTSNKASWEVTTEQR